MNNTAELAFQRTRSPQRPLPRAWMPDRGAPAQRWHGRPSRGRSRCTRRFPRRRGGLSDTVCCYRPDYRVLGNKLDPRGVSALDHHERELVAQRIAEGVPTGGFDLTHLRAIHRHPFREGNGRTQALYLERLVRDAGHSFDLRGITKDRWRAAAKAARSGGYDSLGSCIREAITV